MAKPKKLTQAEIAAALVKLPGWKVVKAKLHREYKFPDFIHAFGFMATCATAIQAMDHHPEWFNVYGTVKIDLSTHDAGGITTRDFRLAKVIDRLAHAAKG